MNKRLGDIEQEKNFKDQLHEAHVFNTMKVAKKREGQAAVMSILHQQI
jgi:hypothetical protein